MSTAATSATKPRRWLAPRFSLRALLIGMTLLCLVFAPVLPELNRARNVARQVKIIEDMGGECVFIDRPRSFFARIVQNYWPVKIAHIEHDLLMAEFNAQTVDLAKLRQTPAVRGVCFNECLFVLPEDEPEVRLPRIEYVQLQERDDVKGGKPDPAILGRFPAFFPNLRKAQLMGVPQEQAFIDALGACERLEDLDMWFRSSGPPTVSTSPLVGLTNLTRLRLSGTRELWNWSFLEKLVKLKDVELGHANAPIGMDITSRYDSAGLTTFELDPSQALAKLKTLRRCELFEWSGGQPPIGELTSNNDLESFRIARHWPTVATLEALQGESNLRVLKGVRVNEGAERVLRSLRPDADDDAESIFEVLRRFPRLQELEIHFTNLTDRDLRYLSEFKSLERIVLSFDPHQGAITSEGINLFRKLPVAELRYQYSSGLPLAEGMQRLIDSWPGPGPGKPSRQTDEGVQFLLREARK
jgi:hypothetical protein